MPPSGRIRLAGAGHALPHQALEVLVLGHQRPPRLDRVVPTLHSVAAVGQVTRAAVPGTAIPFTPAPPGGVGTRSGGLALRRRRAQSACLRPPEQEAPVGAWVC